MNEEFAMQWLGLTLRKLAKVLYDLLWFRLIPGIESCHLAIGSSRLRQRMVLITDFSNQQ